jgi:hypothetical protein
VIPLGISTATGSSRGSVNIGLLGLTHIRHQPLRESWDAVLFSSNYSALPAANAARMRGQLRSLFGFVWEFGANFLFLVAAQSSQIIRARIADFQKGLNV